MEKYKSKSLKNIEEMMQNTDLDPLRYRVLEGAKNFKTSWIELGQALYSVWKDKLYREWGFTTFEAYTAKETGIRKQTAMKLLRSYYFLEKEEPWYLKQDFINSKDAAKVPSYESIDILRMARNKKALDESDYENIKKEIFDDGLDARQVRRGLTSLIRQRQELAPEEAQRKRKEATIKRLIGTLKSLMKEAEILKLLPAPLVKETAELIKRLEEHVS